jgi:uncharacterized protein (TIGR03435 family)
MQRFALTDEGRRKPLLGAPRLAAIIGIVVLGLANWPQSSAHSQTQDPAVVTPEFKFDVVSIKPTKLGPQDASAFQYLRDGILANNISLFALIQEAYGIYEHDRMVGIPNWLKTERFNVEAKLEGNAVEEFQKLTKERRNLVWRHLLQALLVDHLKLAVHKETRELSVFSLVVAKGGLKLQESKPNPADPNETKRPVFGGTVKSAGSIETGKWIASSDLARWLSGEIGRTVLDKTGLTARYDFSLEYTREQDQLQSDQGETSEGRSASNRTDSTFAPLLTAIQQQLGLKLESGKGPVEVIVIDHIERPSRN